LSESLIFLKKIIMMFLIALVCLVNLFVVYGENLIFYENFTHGIDFSLWKHELVSIFYYHLLKLLK
jgi:hypothetical protein